MDADNGLDESEIRVLINPDNDRHSSAKSSHMDRRRGHHELLR